MDLFKLWELIEFIPPEHLHSDEMLENPHYGVASNDEPVQIDLKCPNGRCIALDLHGFTTWIMFNSHGFTQWEHGPRQGLGWPRLPKIHQIPCLLAAIVHPHASRIECVNLPYFLSHMIHMGVSKRNRVYIPLNPQRSIMNMPKMAVLIDILMIE